ncbi:MAG: methionine adenosyltransferase domain-containing protein [Candidatus Spechtbacterales bacterium]|nr:methionine adenosyltransferase domain-containing protein [Candidatus Spechtbacterales bacterium]
MTKTIYTAEFVSPGHPDKICDYIADSILDAYIKKDPLARCAIEVMGGHGAITISGEVTSSTHIDIESMVKNIVGEDYNIRIFIEEQSPEIAKGVDKGGAGDQGIMVGYATNETETLMPLEYELARSLCREIYKKYPYDGKTQITVEGEKINSVVASFQNSKTSELEEFVRAQIDAREYIINPAGEWKIGGFDADSGLSGRKIAVDSYGPRIPVGGGSFSGKDATKVDRSGAYMARKIAVDYVKNKGANEALVKLAYAIGKSEPVMAVAVADGKEEKIKDYDLRPEAIIKQLELRESKFRKTSKWGHFGNKFKWDI